MAKSHTQAVQDAYQNPQQQQAAPPRQVRKKAGPDVAQLAGEMTAWFKRWQQFSAGFNSLNLALLSHQGKIEAGERKRGLPVFVTHAATIDGEDKAEIVCDLKHVNPEYVPHVLVPLVNAQAMGMMDALLQIEHLVSVLKPALIQITGFDPEQAEEQPEEAPAEEAPEEA